MLPDSQTINSLVIGLGSMAFGKERRAVRTFKQLNHVRPYFLTSKWEDGSVSNLLRENHLDFGIAPFGYLGRAKPHWTFIALLHMPLLFARVISTYLKKRCNVIIVISAAAFVNALPAVLILKYIFGARLVFYLGDSAKSYALNRALARLINTTSELMITNSEAVKRSWTDVGVAKSSVKVIYNGVDVDRFARAGPYDFRSRFDWSSDALIIGFVGQFRPNKGAQDFVTAAKLVLQKRPKCRFVLIGHSTTDDAHQREIADLIALHGLDGRVVFTGWTEQIESYLKGLDILVVPSRHEDPAPNVNIEAMASGIPVVATRVGGTPEIIVDGETGILIEKERPDLIAHSLVRLADDPGLRFRMGQSGIKRVKRVFDIRKNALAIEGVLIEL